jgi:aryl-alcohol dehydrogenase-like predicted oxidoreductase
VPHKVIELVSTQQGALVSDSTLPGGTFSLAPGFSLTRIGYGSMQLAGPGVFGPPKDRDEAVAVLREVVESGITHIDTSDYYGPFVTNEIIKEALHPYPESLNIVTKVGARRDAEGGWPHARTPQDLRQAVHENLDRLGLEALDVVNLRLGGYAGPEAGSLAEPFEALVALQEEGLIRHIGLSTVSAEQIEEAQSIAAIVCVQNFYNVAHRDDDDLVDSLAEQGIAYVPYFPLGGFTPLQSSELASVAERRGTSALAVALAWLMHRSPNILLIPGTSTRAHLRDNIAGASLALSQEDLSELDVIAGGELD